jgi:hypothetical protein
MLSNEATELKTKFDEAHLQTPTNSQMVQLKDQFRAIRLRDTRFTAPVASSPEVDSDGELFPMDDLNDLSFEGVDPDAYILPQLSPTASRHSRRPSNV